MIQNGKDTLLTANPGTLPNMQNAIADWFQTMTFQKVVKTTVNFVLVEALTTFSAMGVRQPFTPQQLLMKPIGQRQWKWETLHCYPDLILDPDEIVLFLGTKYRVMQKLDWKEYGYLEYHLVEDYT